MREGLGGVPPHAVDHLTAALIDVVDDLADGSIVVDHRGSVLYLSTAFDRRFADSDERTLVLSEAKAMAMRASASRGQFDSRRTVGTVSTDGVTYHLRGVALPRTRPGSDPPVIVTVLAREADNRAGPSLSRRYRLTPRQVEIAQLLAKGESNRRIAELLQLSVFTVQHHTRGVLKKLGITRRAAVASRLAGT